LQHCKRFGATGSTKPPTFFPPWKLACSLADARSLAFAPVLPKGEAE
jgi:hypothetical protein